jgi:putative ABC transport system permease protein
MKILRKHPGLAAAALLLLTLGFGALGALLIVDQGVFLDEPPYKDPSRLVTLTGMFDDEGKVEEWGISHIDFLDWRRQNKTFQQMAAFSPGGLDFNLVAGTQAERVSGELVSYNFFSLLGGNPVLGRAFTPEEDGKPFEHRVTVLGYDLWHRRFGGDPKVLGRSVDLNGEKYTVVGVAPSGFRGISGKAEAWIPSSMPPGPVYVSNRRMRWLGGVARLKPGATLEAAAKDMDGVTSALATQFPDSNKGMGVRLAPFKDSWSSAWQGDLRMLTLGAVLLLLFAFVGVAGLLRNRLGAAEGILGAGVLLSVVAAALGLALASWAVSALVPESGLGFPVYIRLWAGPGVIASVLLLAVVIGLGIGLVARAAPGSRGWRLVQVTAVVATVALALTLTAAAGLMAKGYRQAVNRDHLGFDPKNLLIVRVDLQGPKYKTDEQVIELVRRYLARLASLPDLKAYAIAGPTVPTDAWVGGYITIEDHDSGTPAGTYPIMTHSVSPDYFKVMGVPLSQGHGFTAQDPGVPGTTFNVVVSQEMAQKQWPGKNPLGQRLKFSTRKNPEHPWLPVVGVAANIQHEGLMAEKRPAPDLYLPILISPIRLPTTLNFLVRPKAGVSTASLVPVLEREIRAVDPDTPPYDAATQEERLDKQTQKGRFQVGLAVFFALAALTLAVAGVYNAASGIRQGMLLAVAGAVIGLAGAFFLGRRLADLLHGASPGDPLILAGAALLVVLLSLAASAAGRRKVPLEVSQAQRSTLSGRAAL